MTYPRMSLPRMALVRQRFPAGQAGDVPGEVRRALRVMGLGEKLRPGWRVAITAGSRGVASIVDVLRTVAQEVKAAGAEPFVVPAMGSHGGATDEGQEEVLRGYGITPEAVGAPILSSMETVELGSTPSGATVHMDRNAWAAEATIVLARVKPHTAFRGEIESGLCKMMAVGLGKQLGAESMHAHGLRDSIPQAAQLMIERANIVAGVAIVENAYHKIHSVSAVPAEAIHNKDRTLLALARQFLPRVPFDHLDLLVVGWLGKDISGSGMDYNVLGMWRSIGGERVPNYKRIAVLDITPGSHGNGLGVGIADFTTRKLVEKLNLGKTYTNALTSNALNTVKIPIALDSDRETMEVALRSAGPAGEPQVVFIRNTLELERLWVSEALMGQVHGNPALEVEGGPADPAFDSRGDFLWD